MRDGFLQAILEHPDDDALRLVFADWLEDNGEQERAEFIRLQIRMDSLHRPSVEWEEAVIREAELRKRVFGHVDLPAFESLEFGRGFVSSVTAGVLDFRDNAHRLRAEDAPTFALALLETQRDREMLDDDYEAHHAVFSEVAALPELQRCFSLDLPCVGPTAMKNLLSSPYWTNLHRLNAPQSEAGQALRQLDSPTFANLRWLNVRESHSAGGPVEIGVFTGSAHMSNLEYLDFSSNGAHGDDLARLNESRYLIKLRSLDLSESDLGDFEVSYFLFCGGGLPSLKELNLSHCFGDLTDLADAVIQHAEEDIAFEGQERLTVLTRLSKLWLCGNRITDTGAMAIANYPKELSLTLLDLSGNPISEASKRALRKRLGEDVCVFEETTGTDVQGGEAT